MDHVVLVVDLGATDHSFVARSIRDLGVYSEIVAHDLTQADLAQKPHVKGLIFNGGPNRWIDGKKIEPSKALLALDVPKATRNCADLTDFQTLELTQKALKAFLFDTCGCSPNWHAQAFIDAQTAALKQEIGSERVLVALSGGVDSSVVAALLIRAIGKQVVCIHVDHGMLRKGESEEVVEIFGQELGVELIYVDAAQRFMQQLAGVSDPEEKRKRIGTEFIRVFEEEARKLKGIRYLAQGTIYPDIAESGTKTAEGIKSHHNVGGLPDDLAFDLLEPIRYLYKDEVRAVGHALGLPKAFVDRQPFPGPGLAVRCLGALTAERLAAVRDSDAILREEFDRAGLTKSIWQFFTVVPEFKSVGVRDHKRTYEYPVIIRAVHSVDAMTASIAHLDWPVLDHITRRIVNEVPNINRVCYDLTPKPTGTIEWE